MNDLSAGNEMIHLRIDATPHCTRCEGPSLLLVRFPHSWTTNSGKSIKGLRESALCPVCDQGKTDTEALLQLLTARDKLDAAGSEPFGSLVAAWVESLRQEYVDLDLLASEHEQWQRGDL